VATGLRCKRCNRVFVRPPGTNRLYCFDCKPSRAVVVRVEPVEPEPEPVPVPPVERGPGPIEQATRAELESFGRDRSVKGQIALRLARVLDDPELAEARLSAMAGQLEKMMDAATAGALPPADRGDELAEARRLKRAAAGA